MLTRRGWRKLARACGWRVFDVVGRERRGNPLCIMGGVGRRCIYGRAGCEKLAPAKKKEQGDAD